jgi:predicted PolB exonuclease-like 3'-5' exonuclease
MQFVIDIETCPAQNPAVLANFIATIEAPGQYKKPESIAEWLRENGPAAAEEKWRKTSFDGALGHICVIGVSLGDEPAQAIYSTNWQEDEAKVLRQFFDYVDAECAKHPNIRPVFVGHNLIEFDLRFIFQRAVVLGVKPSVQIPFNARPWGDSSVYDTMTAWAGARNTVSLDKLGEVLTGAGKGNMDGSKVWDEVKAGRIVEVAKYCCDDVEKTRQVYRRMTFQ